MDKVRLRKERGMRLNAVRVRSGLTAEEISRRVAINTQGRVKFTTSAVYNWEKGRNLLPAKAAREIAKVLRCTESDLLGPIADEILEGLVLAAPVTSPAPPTSDVRPSVAHGVEILLTLRPKCNPAAGRTRSWLLHYDSSRKRLSVQAGQKTSPHALLFAHPEGSEPHRFAPGIETMPVLADLNDPSVVHVPCDLGELMKQSADGRILSILVGDLISNENVDEWLLKSPAEPHGPPAAPSSLTKDKELQVADFLGEQAGRRLCALWEEGSSYLDRYLDSLSKEIIDPFRRRLVQAVAYICLKTSFESAVEPVQDLVELAGADPKRRAVAYYLSGRCNWYLKQDGSGNSLFPAAVRELAEALRCARVAANEVRQAQCCVYLVRIAADSPNFIRLIHDEIGEDPAALAVFAREVGQRSGRPDIEYLAARSQIILLYNQKKYDAVIREGKKLLSQINGKNSEEKGFQLDAIVDSLRIHIGMALRKQGSEDGRQEAEELYQDGIEKGSDDSHAGICAYLMGDLYADRALGASQDAIGTSIKDKKIRKARGLAAERHLRSATEWYDRAEQMLVRSGDRAALGKAVYRTLWVREKPLPLPTTRQQVVDSTAARHQSITHQLLGKSYAEQTGSIPTSLIEEILSVRFLDASQATEHRSVSANDYVDATTLLIVPWLAGESLNVQLLVLDKDRPQVLRVAGWLVIKDYIGEVQSRLSRLQDAIEQTEWEDNDWERFGHLTAGVWQSISDQLRILRRPTIPFCDKTIIVAPDDPIDALLPLESLVDPFVGGRRLLDNVTGPVVYAGPWAGALTTANLQVASSQFKLFASDEIFPTAALSIRDIVSQRTGRIFESIPRKNAVMDTPGVVLVCHSDIQGKLADHIRSWKLDGVRAVMLLFCGSGTADIVRGPFTTGPAHDIRRKLGNDGVVVASRLPISILEAIRLLESIWDPSSKARDQSIALQVATYIRSRIDDGGNPMAFPWIVL